MKVSILVVSKQGQLDLRLIEVWSDKLMIYVEIDRETFKLGLELGLLHAFVWHL